MNNTKSIYRTTLMFGIALIAMLICCVAFIGCPEGAEMADDVIQPTTPTTPATEETTPSADDTTETADNTTEPGTVGRGGGTPTEDDTGDSDDSGGGGFGDDPNVDP